MGAVLSGCGDSNAAHDHAGESVKAVGSKAVADHDHAPGETCPVAGRDAVADDHDEKFENAVHFPAAQAEQVALRTEHPRMEPFGQVIKTTARVLPSQGDERMIVARASGVVAFDNGNVTEGRAVNAGTRLFSITGGDMADNNLAVKYAEARTNFDQAKATFERKAELRKDKIVSEQDYLAAKSEYENACSVYENLRRSVSGGEVSVASPIRGYVKQVLVQPGAFVEAGQPLAVVSQNRDLLLRAEVSPKYLGLLGSITTANVRRVRDGKTFPIGDLGGKVLSYSKSADSDNFLIPVTFQVANNGEFVPGGFVEVFIRTQSPGKVLTVDNAAIQEEMGSYFVFVELEPEFYEKRRIETGATDGLRTEVRGGLSPDDKVVTTGAVNVRLAQGSGALDAHSGHVH